MSINAAILALVKGEQVAESKLKKDLCDELRAEGLLSVLRHGSRMSYRARDIDALKRYLIDKDEKYRILELETSDSRASMAKETGNSKLLSVRSCLGFPVNSYEPIECLLNGKTFVVNPLSGSFLFVTEWEHFKIPEDVTVIGIENMENFRLIRQQREFIEKYLQLHGLPIKSLFVSRYPQSTDLRRWLMTIPNHYVHFGDFDLAGINIFQSEFQQYLGLKRSSFLIPNDIESRLKYGSIERYDEQYARFRKISSEDNDLQYLINLINRYRKGYDQEGYIN